MNWLIAVVGVIVFVELLLRLPVAAEARRLAHVGTRAQKTLRSARISDHWKEKVLLRYARELLRASVWLAVLIVIAAIPLLAVAALLQWAGVSATLTWLSSAPGLLACTVIGIAWGVLRRSWAARSKSEASKQP